MHSLKDKIVFVTGASAGIGESTAKAFAAKGARILMCARRVERIEKLAKTLAHEAQDRIPPVPPGRARPTRRR